MLWNWYQMVLYIVFQSLISNTHASWQNTVGLLQTETNLCATLFRLVGKTDQSWTIRHSFMKIIILKVYEIEF